MSSPWGQQDTNEASKLEPRCIASTESSVNGPVEDDASSQNTNSKYQNNFFREAQISADGTIIVTHNDDRRLRTYSLPYDLLDDSKQPHTLSPYSVLPSPTNVQSYALYPGFDLYNPWTTLILSAPIDQPIRLTSALSSTYTHATYSYVNSKTEAFIAPNSLEFTPNGRHFIAGSRGAVALFDTEDTTAGPVQTHVTNPRSPTAAAASMRDSGIIMSLSVSPENHLAAGSSNRTVGIFSNCGLGQYETSFSVAPQPEEHDAAMCGGTGITSLAWTFDNTYLLAAERQSDGIHVFDVRNQRRRLAWLSGRNALTTQRLGISTVLPSTGFEVWAGGVDGAVRMWKDPGLIEGIQKPDAEFHDMHSDSVSSVVWHSSGSIMASCSGQRRFGNDEEDEDDEVGDPDNTLRVWGV